MHVTVQPCIRSVHHYGLIFPTGNKTGHMMSSMNCILIILLMLKILKLSKQSRLFLEQERYSIKFEISVHFKCIPP